MKYLAVINRQPQAAETDRSLSYAKEGVLLYPKDIELVKR